MKDYDDATYEIERGTKGMYTVIEWTDGRSLFLDGDGETIFMQEYMEARQLLDAGRNHMERLFGIGSEYHGIADEHEIGICDDGIACEQDESVTLDEHGYCCGCVEQRNYENEKFPLEEQVR
tara:strand:+ start:26 stop:391 length:366 start_codon:yes stop_codon:yes gene_type:complete